ncbi:MAG TPA: Rho termination factor N-terminal domain-containing protein, partial [Actinomycetota bacterium]|nr:Rho termination factor N-terminal domain-containing protein [Actinomycetota bacterium]
MAPDTTERTALEGKVASELHAMADSLGLAGHQRLKKAELIDRILEHRNGSGPNGGSGGKTAIAVEAAPAADAPAAEPTTYGGSNGETHEPSGSMATGEREDRGP